MNTNLKSNKETSENKKNIRLQISSKGKRLLSLILDFILILLFINTISQVTREENWDLAIKFRDFYELIPFYGSIILLLIFKDILGCSIGKFLLGMRICLINDFSSPPSIFVLFSRNIFLLMLPVEGIIILKDDYARRFADKWHGTIVVDKKNPIRPILRILLGNIIIFSFFSIAIFYQNSSIEKSAAYKEALLAIKNHKVLKILLDKNPEIQEPEMHLDLRGNQIGNSIVQVRVGDEEQGRLVKVFLKLQYNPKSWEVVNIQLESIKKFTD